MSKRASKNKIKKKVETITHDEASRKNIPTAEYQSILKKEDQDPIRVAYERRNRDLDPQLVWRGKDEQDWSDLVVQAPPLYIQEKVHPKVLIDDLRKQTEAHERSQQPQQMDLFADFNGLPSEGAKTEFYQHDANWSNRMILGDSLQVMASMAEREGLRGKVQCIYIDPPYGIKFNSNFQWSTTSRDVKDGKVDHITREPEQVKAFRDTWRDGIHSYLTYLRDRLTMARDLLTESGSIFVQIGDENVHRVRALMDEIFGEQNCVCLISAQKTSAQTSELLTSINDYVIWYAKEKNSIKYRQLFQRKELGADPDYRMIMFPGGEIKSFKIEEAVSIHKRNEGKLFRYDQVTSQTGTESSRFEFEFCGKKYKPAGSRGWSTSLEGLNRLTRTGRIVGRKTALAILRFFEDYPVIPLKNVWNDVALRDLEISIIPF